MRVSDLSLFLALPGAVVASEITLFKGGQSPAYFLARSESVTLHKVSSSFNLMARLNLMPRQSAGAGESGSAGSSDFCTGIDATCQSCFGTNWAPCSDGITCYDTTDPKSTCSTGSASGSGSSSSGSSSGSSGTDTCTGKAITCTSCFGPGYILCSDGITCYDPSDPTTSCPGGSGSASGTDSGFGPSPTANATGDGSGLESPTTSEPAAGTPTGLGSIGSVGGGESSANTATSGPSEPTNVPSESTPTNEPNPNTTSGPLPGNGPLPGIKSSASSLFSQQSSIIPFGLSSCIGAAILVAVALL